MSTTDTATLTHWQQYIVNFQRTDEDGIHVVVSNTNELDINIFSWYWRTMFKLKTNGQKE